MPLNSRSFEEALFNELEAVKNGEKLPAEAVVRLFDNFPRLDRIHRSSRSLHADRKAQLVAYLRAHGINNRAIAERMGITPCTEAIRPCHSNKGAAP